MIKCGIPHKVFKFSGGELQVKIFPVNGTLDQYFTEIYAHITSADEVMELFLLTDAIRRVYPEIRLGLHLPYLPYARQDRVCAPGESLALKVFCNLINSQNYKHVWVDDVHSPVSLALLDRVQDSSVRDLWVRFRNQLPLTNTILVAPDSGSLKKVGDLAKEFGLRMVRADKIRDVQNGEILETKVYSDHVGDANFLIADDICDGGRTFLELAKVLRPLTKGRVDLYVTHGIFSKGIDIFRDLIDTIYTVYPFPNIVPDPTILKVLK